MEKEKKEEKIEEVNKEEKNEEIESLKNEIKNLKKEKEKEKEKNLLARADIENIKKITKKEIENIKKYSTEKIVKEIILIYDSLEYVEKNKERDKKEDIIEGVNQTIKIIKQIFEKMNIKEINPINKQFDPTEQEAVSTTENKSKNKNDVQEVLQKGFKINEKVIRTAKVIINR